MIPHFFTLTAGAAAAESDKNPSLAMAEQNDTANDTQNDTANDTQIVTSLPPSNSRFVLESSLNGVHRQQT
jgi:hypothetical protein